VLFQGIWIQAQISFKPQKKQSLLPRAVWDYQNEDTVMKTILIAGVINLVPGFITQINCDGRLLLSAIGNEKLVHLEAMPKELGCGVLLKPLTTHGKTNLILETSAGKIQKLIEIKDKGKIPEALEINLKGDAK
jgi:hypothetical protein